MFCRWLAPRVYEGGAPIGAGGAKTHKKNEEYAKQLSKEMTPWERKLWYCFLKDYPHNLDIENNFYGVCTIIDREVKARM